MNIFEDKTPMLTDGPDRPVRTVMIPSETRDYSMNLINHHVEQDANVRHVQRPRLGCHY